MASRWGPDADWIVRPALHGIVHASTVRLHVSLHKKMMAKKYKHQAFRKDLDLNQDLVTSSPSDSAAAEAKLAMSDLRRAVGAADPGLLLSPSSDIHLAGHWSVSARRNALAFPF